MALKDKDLDDYYTSIFGMAVTPGYKHVLDLVETMIAEYSDITRITNVENLHYNKGRLDILLWLKNLKAVYEEAYNQMEKAEAEDE